VKSRPPRISSSDESVPITDRPAAFELLTRKRISIPPPAAPERPPATSALAIALGELARSKLAFLGATVMACFALVAIFADLAASDLPIACRLHDKTYILPGLTRPPALAPYDCQRTEDELGEGDWAVYPLVRFGPTQTSARGKIVALLPPYFSGAGEIAHPLGTDDRGRDVFARLVHGARTSLTVGLLSVVAFIGIGAVLGALAGFYGGLVDSIISRLIETLTAFPTLVLVLVIQGLVAHPTLSTMLLAIGLTRWTEVARLVRAEVLLVVSQEYVLAARALGARPARVLIRHVLPNAVAPMLVAATFGVASVVLIEASLTFLRVGVPPPTPSWGEMLSEARDHALAWWLLVFPGLAVFVTVVALNLVGEALRDALDPRQRHALDVGASRSPEPPTRGLIQEGTRT
jgi:peptide/nickel transport system permease protein